MRVHPELRHFVKAELPCVFCSPEMLYLFQRPLSVPSVDPSLFTTTAHCGLDAVFHYTTWGVWISVALVRVYRSWKILIKHSVDMWPPWAQVLLLTVPWW